MSDVRLATIFAGRRGRLLAGLLLAEFAAAVQSVAYSSVLPLAARDLDGRSLYGATLAAGSLTTILVLCVGAAPLARLGPRRTLLVATTIFVLGVAISATAPAMALLLTGSVLRGLAGGLLAGFGLTALGALYEDHLRPRVLGLYAMVWLLPSLLGPVVNASIAVAFGWRWAMAWPALLVVGGRMLVGRDADLVPVSRDQNRLGLHNGALVLLGLVAASCASATRGWIAATLFVCGLLVAGWASLRTVHALLGPHAARTRAVVIFLALCLAFFGGHELVSLAVIAGLGAGAVASNIAVGLGLVAWSVAGARPPRADLRQLGFALLAAGLAAEALAQAVPNGVIVAVGAWALGGAGMGLAYPRLYSAPVDALAPEDVATVATAVAFAELVGVALGALLGGGGYSLLTSLHAPTGTAITVPFAVLAGIACLGQFGGARRARIPSTSTSVSG